MLDSVLVDIEHDDCCTTVPSSVLAMCGTGSENERRGNKCGAKLNHVGAIAAWTDTQSRNATDLPQ
jgi:hypothetical protein